MKKIITALLFFSAANLKAQNFISTEGEFMDTSFIPNHACGKKDIDGPAIYYYQVSGKYPKSSQTILKEVQSHLSEKSQKYSGSGYVTFRCTIDCEGKRHKKVQVLQTDESYKNYHFDKAFVNDLYSYFTTLDQWKPARIQNADTLVNFNYQVFISFKIRNGKVINIIP